MVILMENLEPIKSKIIIYVEGGLVQEVYSSDPNTDIKIYDFDIFDHEKLNNEGLTKKQYEEQFKEDIKDLKY